jgi:hypothetical protein
MAGRSSESVTSLDVARWILGELEREGFLYQDVLVHQIAERFGQEFTYDNKNGNLAIDRRVLNAFRDLTSGSVVWESGQRMWRERQDNDEPGKRKQY